MKKEDMARGGHTSSQKVYYCHDCNSIGRGQKMISHHLQGCNGQGRKTKKSTQELQHRLEEAKINTELWVKQQQEAAIKEDYLAAKERILQSIEQIRSEFGTSYQISLEQYYQKLF